MLDCAELGSGRTTNCRANHPCHIRDGLTFGDETPLDPEFEP
jgi:hypothetical protein